jgi:peroxiredoxin 2/4
MAFFPMKHLRTIFYYPLSLGRNFDEIYQALIASKTADELGITPPPLTGVPVTM